MGCIDCGCKDGDRGSQGIRGPQGDIGATGNQGLAGTPGLVGATGATGPKGDQGIQGVQGQTGSAGTPGSVGSPGSPGANGSNGTDGAVGATGPDGADGDSAYQVWLDEGNVGSEAVFLDSLIGPQGPQGPSGNKVWTFANNNLYSIADDIDQAIITINPVLTNFSLPVAGPSLTNGRTVEINGGNSIGTFKLIAPAGVQIFYGTTSSSPGGSVTFSGDACIEVFYAFQVAPLYVGRWIINKLTNPSGSTPLWT